MGTGATPTVARMETSTAVTRRMKLGLSEVKIADATTGE